mmetsp:Transcript_21089/g.75014  ORF Transcript_21089/g.75014 Transcript_21089/m.75014 type:complete len:107 (-) Transcript_21089:61-381(-)
MFATSARRVAARGPAGSRAMSTRLSLDTKNYIGLLILSIFTGGVYFYGFQKMKSVDPFEKQMLEEEGMINMHVFGLKANAPAPKNVHEALNQANAANAAAKDSSAK